MMVPNLGRIVGGAYTPSYPETLDASSTRARLEEACTTLSESVLRSVLRFQAEERHN